MSRSLTSLLTEISTSNKKPPPSKIPSLYDQLNYFVEHPFVQIKTTSQAYTKLDRFKEIIDKEPGIHTSRAIILLNTSDNTLKTYHKALRADGYRVIRANPKGMNYFPPKFQEESEDE